MLEGKQGSLLAKSLLLVQSGQLQSAAAILKACLDKIINLIIFFYSCSVRAVVLSFESDRGRGDLF